MRIFVTGGGGYIGCHAALHFLRSGCKVAIYDNFTRLNNEAINQLIQSAPGSLVVMKGDVRNITSTLKAVRDFGPETVVHLAGIKEDPLDHSKSAIHFSHNFNGTQSLLAAMSAAGVKRLVFSSSAAVYGSTEKRQFIEDQAAVPSSPYGESKFLAERAIANWTSESSCRSAIVLRIFNPSGLDPFFSFPAFESSSSRGLIANIGQATTNGATDLSIYGSDHPTPDGTAIRDYFHISDLSMAISLAVDRVLRVQGVDNFNLGRGVGLSILEVLRAFEMISGRNINYRFVGRRKGEASECVACTRKTASILNWRALEDIEAICRSEWTYQSKNK